MANYPVSLPNLGSVTHADSVDVADFNARNDEIEALATELGTNPKSIDDTVAPEASPADVADYLDQLGTIVKTIAGVDHWYQAAVPSRNALMWHGGGGTTGGVAYAYIGFGAIVSAANYLQAQIVVPFTGRIRLRRFYVQTLTAVSSTDNAVKTFQIWVNDSETSRDLLRLAPEDPAGVYQGIHDDDRYLLDLTAGDYIGIRIGNQGNVDSPQIGAVSIEYDQVG